MQYKEQERLEGTSGLLTGKRGKQETLDEYIADFLDNGMEKDLYMEIVKKNIGKLLFGAQLVDVEPEPAGLGIKLKIAVPIEKTGVIFMRSNLYNNEKRDLLLAHDCFGKNLRDPDFIVTAIDKIHGSGNVVKNVLFDGTPAISSNGKPYFKITNFHVLYEEKPMAKLQMMQALQERRQDEEINRQVAERVSLILGSGSNISSMGYTDDREETYVARPRTLADELPPDDDEIGGFPM